MAIPRWVRNSWPLVVGVVLAGCAETPLGPEPPSVVLEIENPFGLEFVVAGADDGVPILAARSTVHATFIVRSGLYEMRVRDGDRQFRMPAPLLAEVLSRRKLTVRIPRADAEDWHWAWIPAGPSVLGDLIGVGQEDERPARIVKIPSFWLGRFEVTNADFVAFLEAMGDGVESDWLAFESKKCGVRKDSATGSWTTSEPRLPVVTVSLAGAEAYCDWLTRRTGVRHRLPSEAEWEKAARGPRSLTYDYGNVYKRSAANQESGRLVDVGRFAASDYGLHDMTGNAFEWVSDHHDPESYLKASLAEASATASAVSESSSEFHVLRGGSFVLDGMYLRNSFRMRQRPSIRTDDFGFRVAREAPPTREE